MLTQGRLSEMSRLITKRIKNMFSIYLPRHTYADEVFMISITNAIWQDMHTDICGILDERANLVGGVNLSYSFILSLSDDCYIWEYFPNRPRKKHMILKGHIFIFACDLVHGGMELPDHQFHIRIHGLLKSPEYRNGGRTQGWLDKKNGSFFYKEGCGSVREDID